MLSIGGNNSLGVFIGRMHSTTLMTILLVLGKCSRINREVGEFYVGKLEVGKF